jgi:hypothetical protein
MAIFWQVESICSLFFCGHARVGRPTSTNANMGFRFWREERPTKQKQNIATKRKQNIVIQTVAVFFSLVHFHSIITNLKDEDDSDTMDDTKHTDE